MGLHLPVNSDASMAQNGLGLVAADAVQAVHDKIEQLIGLLDLTHDGLVIVAGHAVVMLSSHLI